MQRHAARGFTLLEAMIVVAIMGIMASLAAWSMQGAINRSKVVGAEQKIYNIIADARNLALVKNAQVVVIFDLDTTATSSGHGGVFEILDPAREFKVSAMSGWASGYSPSSGINPVVANQGGVFNSTSQATLRDAVRLTDQGLAGIINPQPTAAQIDAFGSPVLQSVLASSPWKTPSSTGVSNAYAGRGCSFCSATVGYLLFLPDGTLRLSNPDHIDQLQPSGAKGWLLYARSNKDAIPRALFIASPLGLVKAQESI